ncbi:Permease PerM [Moritella viscosa]|uniref:Permease PerM n=1 Tax=Moritella viscosa TaxID=80854 RepID=A0A090IGV0_9GAMM|nr:AI-2E family transporter [Moritella viscosa]CED61446.1 putative permease PerM [Moritella viscosa]SGY96843.1 Permease PerM [Moritella viscosa]SHO04469.1 Permease PerM [Moritella viscosa]SHO04475.1 Permease PerM [Moritella viscosa]SHO05306.1 Permease PerM [Moritella viscosa]
MISVVSRWYQERFSDPHAVTLFLLLVFGFSVIYFIGGLITPFLVAVVLAYLLDWPLIQLMRLGISRTWATVIILMLFVTMMVMFTLGLVPTVWHQGVNLVKAMPTMLKQGQEFLLMLPKENPDVFNEELIKTALLTLQDHVVSSGEAIVSASFASLFDLAAILIYSILVPLLVFFMLKDKNRLVKDLVKILPQNRRLAMEVWTEMNGQIANYIRGKVFEIIIVGFSTWLVFFFTDLQYAALLAVLVGFSVLIPYIGAAAVTVPVMVVGLFQWGLTPEFTYMMIAYGIVQALDGNLLVPLLFSEAVNLHPVAIIMSVLLFGGLWGFWGVFFAIPLATLVKAVFNAWPKRIAEEA